MRTFRIDNRDFNVGDIIEPQREYQDKLNDTRKKVEDILEQHRPTEKPSRNTILMLFQEFEDAKKHWTIQSNSKYYQVDIDDNDILHTGAYNKVEQLFKNLDNPDNANRIAQEYWDGQMTDNPKPEIFVDNSTVDQVVSNSEQERKNAFAIRAGYSPMQGVRIITNNE